MVSPIDYQLHVQSPFAAALAGYQGGAMIRDDQQQQEQQALAKQQAAQQQQAMQRDLQSILVNPNATPRDFAAMTLKYPSFAAPFKQASEMMSAEQRQNTIGFESQVYAALDAGAHDVAKDLLQGRVDAMRYSGDEKGAAQYETGLKLIDVNPTIVRNMLGNKLVSMDEKLASSLSALNADRRANAEAPADLAKKNADAVAARANAGIKQVDLSVAPAKAQLELRKGASDIANTDSQIGERAARLGLDRDKLTSEVQMKLYENKQKNGELPEFVAKEVTTATTEAIAAQQSAARMQDLANQIDAKSKDMGSGVAAQQWEAVKRAGGWQNETTRLRSEYSRIVTPAAMAAYRKVSSGSTSDKDIDIAMQGVPKDTDPPERMASFLRGAAKLQVYDTVLNNAKAEWLGANKFLGKAKEDIEIDGVKVPAGTTFKNFTDSYVDRKAGEISAAARVKSLAAKYGAQPATTAAPAAPAQLGGATGSY